MEPKDVRLQKLFETHGRTIWQRPLDSALSITAKIKNIMKEEKGRK